MNIIKVFIWIKDKDINSDKVLQELKLETNEFELDTESDEALEYWNKIKKLWFIPYVNNVINDMWLIEWYEIEYYIDMQEWSYRYSKDQIIKANIILDHDRWYFKSFDLLSTAVDNSYLSEWTLEDYWEINFKNFLINNSIDWDIVNKIMDYFDKESYAWDLEKEWTYLAAKINNKDYCLELNY